MSSAIQSKEKALVFISYAREDQEFVNELVKKLDQYNVEPVGDWLLIAGEQYEVKLKDLNLRAQCLVFVITPDSIKSQACLNELAIAVESKKQVLPVSRRDHGDDSRLDSALRAPQWIFLRDGNDFDAGVQEMVEAINTDFDLMEMHGRLLSAAENWSNNGKNRSYLLRKDGLREAEVWLGKTSVHPDKLPQPTELEVEYILASQRARSRGTKIAIGIALGIFIALSALTIVALVQRARAVSNEERAVSNEERARAQQHIAEENARRAVEVGKRRLVIATLLVNPEATQLTTVMTYPEANDLAFGVVPWQLRDGTLKKILQRFQDEAPETFVQIFADGDAAKAQRLIAYAGKRRPGSADGSQKDPEFNLTDEQWLDRFRKAGANPALQAVQLRAFTEIYLQYLDELNRVAPIVKTERGLAFLLDIAYQMGVSSAKKALEEAQQERSAQNESELLARLKEITTQRMKRIDRSFAKKTEERRQLFLASPYLSDQELGF